MKKTKEFIVGLFNSIFNKSDYSGKKRRLIINEKTGKLSWSKGTSPFGEGPDEEEIKKAQEEEFRLEDDKEKGIRMFREHPGLYEPYRLNRFEIDFPGIPHFYFQSYKYIGTDVHSERKFFFSKKVIKDDYSSFEVLMLFPSAEFDICDKLRELEDNPFIGDVSINLLDPTGLEIKSIIIPECEVVEIKAFRGFEYGEAGDKSDTVLKGEIVVKHKQRKIK